VLSAATEGCRNGKAESIGPVRPFAIEQFFARRVAETASGGQDSQDTRQMATRFRIHDPALLYFDAVRRAASIRGAARRLNVASSAINRQIIGLEAELGMKLFDRLPGGLRLTAAGEILAGHVTTVLQDAERTRSELDALAGLRTGHIEIATLEGLCHQVIPTAIQTLGLQSSRITVGIGILPTADIPEAVASGEAHLGLAFEVRPRAELRKIAAARLPLGVVVRRDSPLARRGTLSLRDCADQQFILPRANFANREQLVAALSSADMRGRMLVDAGSIELMTQLVRRGLGVAFMTRIGIEEELAEGEIVHVPLLRGRGPVVSELGLYARAGVTLPVAAEMFARILAAQMAEAAAGGAATPRRRRAVTARGS
jgi:DNA-binding transcriptional LysR family regulator